jgi:hypothetical protein
MADKKSLSMFGLIFGVVTAAVMLVAAVTVQAQIDGRLGPDGASPQIVAGPASVLSR